MSIPPNCGDSGFSEYSLVQGLLFCVVALTPARELSPWEQLFVVQTLGLPVHRGYLADVYMACGCFAEARLLYADPEHRKRPVNRILANGYPAGIHRGGTQAARSLLA